MSLNKLISNSSCDNETEIDNNIEEANSTKNNKFSKKIKIPLLQIFRDYSSFQFCSNMRSKDLFILCVKTLSMVLLYFLFSISLTFYNKKLMTGTKLALSITMVHLLVKFFLSCLCRCCYTSCTKVERINISFIENLLRISPPGVASSLDIGFSNWGLEFITVSLYTMTKSTAIIFILIFSVALKLEKPKISIVLVVFLISTGLILFTYQSTQFILKGFLLVLAASCLSGIRWTLSQLVMQRSQLGLTNAIDMVYYIQPWMILALFPMMLLVEHSRLNDMFSNFSKFGLETIITKTSLVIFGALLAFAMECSEYMLLSFTSSLTLSVSGIFKEVITLTLASFINQDKMSNENILGLVICLGGIIFHVVIKANRQAREHLESLSRQESMETAQPLVRKRSSSSTSNYAA